MQAIIDLYALVLGRPAFYRLNKLLFRFALAGLGVLNWRSDRLRGEKVVLKRILEGCDDGSVVLDVGANEGGYSELVLDINPRVVVHAFEPHPETFKRLKARLGAKGVHCWNVALGDIEEESVLFDYADVEGGSTHASHGAGHSRPVNSGKLLVAASRTCAARHRSRYTRSFQSGM